MTTKKKREPYKKAFRRMHNDEGAGTLFFVLFPVLAGLIGSMVGDVRQGHNEGEGGRVESIRQEEKYVADISRLRIQQAELEEAATKSDGSEASSRAFNTRKANLQFDMNKIAYAIMTDKTISERAVSNILGNAYSATRMKVEGVTHIGFASQAVEGVSSIRECQLRLQGNKDFGANKETASAIAECANDREFDFNMAGLVGGVSLPLIAAFAIPALRRRREYEVSDMRPIVAPEPVIAPEPRKIEYPKRLRVDRN